MSQTPLVSPVETTNEKILSSNNRHFNKDLFSELYQQKIQELIKRSNVPEAEVAMQIEPVYKTEWITAQIGLLTLGSKKIVFYSLEGRIINRQAIEEFMTFTTDFINYVRENHAYSVALSKIVDLSLNSMLQIGGIKLFELDKKSSIASRVGLLMEGGVLPDIAKLLTQSVSKMSGMHHQLALHTHEEDALSWMFDGIEKEMGLG